MHTLEQLRAGELAGVTRLQIRAGLTEFPDEIFDLADSLEILDLSGNALTRLPDNLPLLKHLRIIFCSDNQFTKLPEVLGSCSNLTMIGFRANQITSVPASALPSGLRWLVLTDNRLEQLPDELGQCADLQKLMLSGNRLRTLPPTLANCEKLELLRIAANNLSELPQWLLAMPRLAWLAFAGNPFSATHTAAPPPVTNIPWRELTLQEKLGEGASGIIHRAKLNDEYVAVKVFKGAMTSDGLPEHEMAACIGAGRHPNLIPVLGIIPDHPARVPALVMPLIDSSLRNLAGPPNLQSCTRDIYAEDAWFSVDTVLNISSGIASAAERLHAQGIMHGDLYGHNILYCGNGNAVLGDFGAASLFEPRDSLSSALEQIEVRAFGCLLEELLERSDANIPSLQQLMHDCLHPSPQGRPAFAEVVARLSSLAP